MASSRNRRRCHRRLRSVCQLPVSLLLLQDLQKKQHKVGKKIIDAPQIPGSGRVYKWDTGGKCLVVCIGGEWRLGMGLYMKLYGFVDFIYRVFVLGTAFATCLLCVTKALSLSSPFYRVNEKAITCSVILFLSSVAVINLIAMVRYFYYYLNDSYLTYQGLTICILFLIILVVAVSNIIAIVNLPPKDRTRSGEGEETDEGVVQVGDGMDTTNERNATVTVLILSALFCTLNLFNVAYVLCELYSLFSRDSWFYHTLGSQWTDKLDSLAYFVVLPLKSSLNPAVYFLRIKGMRDY